MKGCIQMNAVVIDTYNDLTKEKLIKSALPNKWLG